jgi:hypothetical protein
MAFPSGILGLPGLVALVHPVQSPLRLGSRAVGSEPVAPWAQSVGGLYPTVRKAPVILAGTTATHAITVHPKRTMRYRFAQKLLRRSTIDPLERSAPNSRRGVG